MRHALAKLFLYAGLASLTLARRLDPKVKP